MQLSGVPVVDVIGTWPASEVASIHTNNVAVGRMAAQHLLDKGVRNFAFMGAVSALHSQQRRDSFVAELKKAGFTCAIFEPPTFVLFPDAADNEMMLMQWLLSLPKPAGILCWFDYAAVAAQNLCRRAGIKMPDEVALIGVENDDLCSLQCPVPLTSIDLAGRSIGFKAMQLLDRMIHKGYRPTRHLLVPPGKLISRHSSDVLAITHAEVAKAMRYIHDNAHRPILVTDLVRDNPISRRRLEIQFKKIIGRTPCQEIQRTHVEFAKTLLDNPELTLTAIAIQSGFKSHAVFNRTFRRWAKCTPGEYRQRVMQR